MRGGEAPRRGAERGGAVSGDRHGWIGTGVAHDLADVRIPHPDGEMEREAEFLRSKGAVARYTVEKGQPHRLDTLAGANAHRLFDGFEDANKGCVRRQTTSQRR